MEKNKLPIWLVHLKTPLGRTKEIRIHYWDELYRVSGMVDCCPVNKKKFGDRIIIPQSNIIIIVKEKE